MADARFFAIGGGVWQGALAHITTDWASRPLTIGQVMLMAEEVEHIPRDIPIWNIPIDDNANGCNQLEYLRRVAKTVAGLPCDILTVCHMGENRSGLMSALLLRERLPKLSAADIVAAVQSRGPHNTTDHATSFWNPGFVAQVLNG